MTGKQIAKDVRLITNDSVSPYTLGDDDDLVAYINEAIQELTIKRPDCLLDTDGSYITVTDLDDINDTISLVSYWKTPIVNYVISKCYNARGTGDENQKRAGYFMGQFLKSI